MLKLNYNPCRKRYDEWLSQFSLEQQRRITEIGDDVNKSPKLIKLKRNRKPVEVNVGDIFLVSNKDGLYFYGKVLQRVNTKHPKYHWSENCFVAFIFKCTTKEKNLYNYSPNYSDYVCGPELLDSSYWEKGYLEIIGNIPLTNEEKNLDIGFFDGNQNGGSFLDAQGKILNHCPNYYEHIGFVTSWGISIELSIVYITDPSLLE